MGKSEASAVGNLAAQDAARDKILKGGWISEGRNVSLRLSAEEGDVAKEIQRLIAKAVTGQVPSLRPEKEHDEVAKKDVVTGYTITVKANILEVAKKLASGQKSPV